MTKLFYQNNYPIIGIENQNGGVKIILAQVFHQLLQVKTKESMHFSGRKTDIYKHDFENMLYGTIDVETCKQFNDIDDFMDGITDDYSTGTKNIPHKRTKTFYFGTKEFKKWVLSNRKILYNYGMLKRPTDIIIFTDGFSFNATSLLIKGFQKTGGAIIVGFNGNPTLSNDL